MVYGRQTGPESFYKTIMTTWPALRYDLRLYSFILYLMFPIWLDDDTGKIVIEQELIAKIVKQERKLQTGTFIASHWLDKIKELLPRFEYSSYTMNKARMVDVIEWPQQIQKGLDDMRANYYNKEGDVYLLTGQKVNRTSKNKIRTEDKNYALELEKDRQAKLQKMAKSGVEEADKILAMLNALSSNIFTRMIDSLDDVWTTALDMPEGTPVERAQKTRVLNILRAVSIQPQPFYKAVDKSARLYNMNASFLQLPRNLRKLFTADLTTLDLRASQLTIIATDWNIPWLHEFLANDGNVWRYFFEELGLDYGLKQSNIEEYERIKAVLKHEGLYAIVYGRKENVLLKSTNKEFIRAREAFRSIGTTVEAFLNTRMIQEVIAARSRVYAEIRKNKGARDIFDRWIDVDKNTSVESVASQLTQAVELKLMYPIVVEAFNTTQFEIVVWLHDSVSIRFDKKERALYWIEKLKTAVSIHAKSLGYNITLEQE